MKFIELLYSFKKKVKKMYRDYFTVEGTYTSLLPDRIYIKKLYKKRMGKELDLKNPTTYNEKLNWLKLYDRQPKYTMMVDKYAVRQYVAKKIGKQYLVPLVGCWDKVEEIEFEKLPEKFVLKCNHDNGVIICKNKKELNIGAVKKELEFHLQRNYYKKTREWAYKNVKKRIICEKYMEDSSQKDLNDYKFFCFDGKVKMLFVATDRTTDTHFDFYDNKFNHLSLINGYPNSDKKIEKPEKFDEMINIAENLSKDIPHVRVDLYFINGKIYFSEMTFYHDAGLAPFKPEKWDSILGDYLVLPKRKKLRF